MASPPSSPSPPPSPTPSITPSLLQSTFSHLPVMSMRKKIIDKIQQNRVTLIIGETGCGITSLTVWFFSSFYFVRTAFTVSNNFTLRCWNFLVSFLMYYFSCILQFILLTTVYIIFMFGSPTIFMLEFLC